MHGPVPQITSPQNPQVKHVVRLRKRTSRNREEDLLVEGYRECRRALENQWPARTLYFARAFFTGKNEEEVLRLARDAGVPCVACTEEVFRKMAYRDRPEGLLALGPPVDTPLEELPDVAAPLYLVAEAIEKPGNLGTALRTADATGTHAVMVCDACTDLANPNVVRASIGTLFTVPVVKTDHETLHAWLKQRGVQVVAATPHTDTLYTGADLTGPVAIVVGAEQVGLSDFWMERADLRVRIPMLGQVDSLNVAAATTLLLYDAVRQRSRPSKA